MLYLTSSSLRELDAFHLLQDLIGCSLLGLFSGCGGSGPWQHQIHPFKGHVYPRNPHLVGEVQVAIRPSVADVYLILWLAKPSCLTHPIQEYHMGCYTHFSRLEWRGSSGAFGRVLGGSRSSNCSAETWRGGWRLAKVEDVV